jgi:hypothetical protein
LALKSAVSRTFRAWTSPCTVLARVCSCMYISPFPLATSSAMLSLYSHERVATDTDTALGDDDGGL